MAKQIGKVEYTQTLFVPTAEALQRFHEDIGRFYMPKRLKKRQRDGVMRIKIKIEYTAQNDVAAALNQKYLDKEKPDWKGKPIPNPLAEFLAKKETL